MGIKYPIRHSMDEIMSEMKIACCRGDDILLMDAQDRFFLGGGCEAYTLGLDAPNKSKAVDNPMQNISACMIKS